MVDVVAGCLSTVDVVIVFLSASLSGTNIFMPVKSFTFSEKPFILQRRSTVMLCFKPMRKRFSPSATMCSLKSPSIGIFKILPFIRGAFFFKLFEIRIASTETLYFAPIKERDSPSLT